MDLLIFILNDHEKLDAILTELEKSGIRGATVIDSTGMAKVLHHDKEEVAFLGTLRSLLNPATRAKSNTILMVLEKKMIHTAVEAIERIVGDLNQENVGVIFSIPVDFTKGIKKHE